MKRPRPLILLAALLLAGCSGPGESDAAAPTAAPTPTPSAAAPEGPAPEEAASLDLVDCSQFHTFFPIPTAVFEGTLPEGFQLAPSFVAGQGFVDVFIGVGQCEDGNATLAGGAVTALRAVSEVFFTLVVVPPDNLAGPEENALDLWPLGGFFDAAAAVELYGRWGLADAYGEAAFTFNDVEAGSARLDQASIQAGFGTYFVDTLVQPDDTPFEASYRLWVPGDGAAGVRGHVRVDTVNGEGIGLGEATFRYVGDEILPPLVPGLAHRVGMADVHAAFVPLAAEP